MPGPTDLPPALAATPLGRPGAAAWIKRVAVGLGVLAVATLLAVGGSTPGDPHLAGEGRSGVAGFDEATLVVLAAGRGLPLTTSERCTLLASTAEQTATGMMGKASFSGYDGMAFLFEADTRTRFFNRRVPIALSVAWFDAEGRWVGSGDLEPCGDVQGCPTIGAAAPFRYALEVPKGGLAALGLGPGSQIALRPGPC